MKIGKLSGAVAFSLAAAVLADAPPAQAGNVSNAVLGCYVDTYAFDVPTVEYCGAAWTPGTASNPTVAVFEVLGLPAGNYSYTWTNLETGGVPSGCVSSNRFCFISIATETRGDGIAQASVTVRDLDTGATKTVYATAEYVDGWN